MEKLSQSNFGAKLKQKFQRNRVETLIQFEEFLICEKFFKYCGLPLLGRVEIGRARKFLGLSFGVFLLSAIVSLISLGVYWGDSKKFYAVVENSAYVSGSLLIMSKTFWLLIYIRKRIKEVVLKLDVHFPHLSIDQRKLGVRKYLKELKLISWIAGAVYFGFALHFIAFSLEYPFYCWLTSQSYSMELMMNHWFPFDPFHPITFVIIFLWHSSVTISGCSLIFLADVTYAGLMMILSMEFDVLALNMSKAQGKSELKKLIKVHQELIEIAGTLEEIFSPMMLIQIVLVIITLCFTAFVSFLELSPAFVAKYFGIFVAFLVNGFILCYFTQKLKDSSSSIVTAAYSTPWYERGLKFRKLVLIVMIIAQEGQKLTAWGFFDVSMETFYWILDTAYSYYSVLMGLYNR